MTKNEMIKRFTALQEVFEEAVGTVAFTLSVLPLVDGIEDDQDLISLLEDLEKAVVGL